MLGINHLVACGFYGLTELTQATEDRLQVIGKILKISGHALVVRMLRTLLLRVVTCCFELLAHVGFHEAGTCVRAGS